jgi:PAS domain S-box-containing protein
MVFLALINNISLIIALSILYSFIIRRWKYGSRTGQAISGILFGAVAVVGMLNPLIISPGLIFDGRSIIISIAGFIGGWVTALIAALMSIIYRTWLGGSGAIMGVSVIASSAAIGIAYHYIRRRRPHVVTPLHLIGFGIIVHICMLALTMTLPFGMKYEVFSNIAIPVILIYPLGTLLVCVVLLDLESRILAEDALRQSEVRYRELFENASEAIFVVQNGKLVFINPAITIMTGYSGEELMSRPFIEFIHSEDREMVYDRHVRRMKGEELPHIYSFRIIHRDGNVRWVELNAVLIKWEEKPATLNFLSDITDRKQAEEALKESENKYRVIAENMTDAITIMDMNLRFTFVSPSIMRLRGFTVEEVMEQPFEQAMTPESLQISARVFEEEMKLEASGTADPDRVRIIELEEYRKDMSTVWVEVSLSYLRDADGRPIGILSLTRDITERKKADEDLRATLASLRKAYGTTIQVMVSAVESRDPYTAGHQVRSANLARCIATEMGLSQDKIEAIRMAGPIHDIGKLSIPAEILSKPTKLTNIEFSLIKEHAQTGYEMLKDVESPWPLAEIVYQHHERMDGSGYPRNLKGDDILMEARIMAISDVVESMASHRPYRPALGLNAALEEIEKNKGTLYDANAADACLRLFRDKGFQLERA